MSKIHFSIVQTHLLQRNHNKLRQQFAPKISLSELSLPRETRRTLAQLRTNKSPILISYLHKVDGTHYPSAKHTTYNRAAIQLHTLLYLKQHTGPLDVLDINKSAEKHRAVFPDLLVGHCLSGCDTVASHIGIG